LPRGLASSRISLPYSAKLRNALISLYVFLLTDLVFMRRKAIAQEI
jgi:hypothetical protein